MQPKFMKSTAALALVLAGTMHAALAAPIVATPGSLAGYTYFPAATTSSGGSGSGSSENVSTLMRCIKNPTINDKTVNLATRNWFDYDKPISVYYKIWGGDGGAGALGGGGGSSAILKNGTPVAIGPGGNGGKTAQMVSGLFTASKTDTIRFIVAGGGGASYGNIVGGGGGAGYKGGGAGASISSGVPASIGPEAAGQGGGSTAGVGGYLMPASMGTAVVRPGTAGGDLTGGVATYPDGSAAAIGASSATGSYSPTAGWYDWAGAVSTNSTRHPATATSSGSYITYVLSYSNIIGAGGGGALGFAGRLTMSNSTPRNYGSFQENNISTSNAKQGHIQNGDVFAMAYTANYVDVGESFTASRSQKPIQMWNGFNYYDASPSGALPGYIAIMYQAPNCEIIPGYSEN